MSVPNPEKGARYLASLDQALCNGAWTEVPELARKVDKHAPDRKSLTLTARSEARIASASLRPTSAGSNASTSTHGLGELVTPLKEAASAGGSHEDDTFIAKICLASIYMLQGEHSNALRSLPSGGTQRRTADARHSPLGWLEVSEVKAAYIRATCLEAKGEHDAARAVYAAVASQSPGSRTPELRRWTERVLALACTRLKQQSDSAASDNKTRCLGAALKVFRSWGDFWHRASSATATTGGTVLDVPRRRVWRAYYDILSAVTIYGLAGHLAKSRQQFVAEFKHVEATYESHLLNETQFPKANQTNVEVESFCAQAYTNFTILCGASFSNADLGPGGKAAVCRNLLDILYRSATKTFHSTAILRFLFHTHTWLGEFDLALHAFDSYVEIVGKGKARAEKTGEHELGFDDDDTAICTAAEAMRTLCRYGDREQAEKAVEIGKNMQKWLKQLTPSSTASMQTLRRTSTAERRRNSVSTESQLKTSTLATAYRAVGVSHAHLARLTYKSDERLQMYDEALNFLLRAETHQPGSLENAHALATVQAETRDTGAAISTLKKALANAEIEEDVSDSEIERHRQLLPLWHLLALCLSGRDEYEATLEICTTTLDSLPTEATDKEAMDDFAKEQVLQLHMTKLVVLELVEGIDVAVARTNNLLGGYSILFGKPATVKEVAKGPVITTPSALPRNVGTLRSIAGSITGRSRSRRGSPSGSPNRNASLVTSAPGSDRASADFNARPGTTGTTATAATNGHGAPIEITITNEEGHPEHHHHRLPFKLRGHHGSSVRSKSADSRRSRATSRTRHGTSPPPPLPRATEAVDHAHLPNTAGDDDGRVACPQRELRDIEHNVPHSAAPPPVGHEKQPPTQDIRLPAPHPAHSYGRPIPQYSPIMQRRHSVTVLSQIWLFIVGLYVRAEALDDAAAAVEEAGKLVDALETEIFRTEAGVNAQRLFEKGWGGGKSIDLLWADVWAARGAVASARARPFDAMSSYEQALFHSPDHVDAVVGLSDLLMDIYEEKIPPEEPRPLLEPVPPASGSNLTFASSTPIQPTPAPSNHSQPNGRSSSDDSSNSAAGRNKKQDPTPAELNRLACRDRAYMLLSTLTKLGSGWDNSAAWLTLARAHELGGEIKKAKQALWWVVELEDARPVRDVREALGQSVGS